MTLHDKQSYKIARLNDYARYSFTGCTVVVTSGISHFSEEGQALILRQVRNFSAFAPDNDPYGQHDFGSFDFSGTRVFWKFDYFDKQNQYLSADLADPEVTNRVLTIMLAEEY